MQDGEFKLLLIEKVPPFNPEWPTNVMLEWFRLFDWVVRRLSGEDVPAPRPESTSTEADEGVQAGTRSQDS